MYKINSQLNRSFKKNNLRRTLLRTESSLQKIIETNRQGSIKKIKHLLQNELRYCSLQKSLQRQKSASTQKLATQISQINPHQRQKGRNLFKKAKIVNQNQTFLCKIKKVKKSVLQKLTEQKGREKAKTHAIGTINSVIDMNTNDKTSFIDSKQTNWNLNTNKKQLFTPLQTRYRTISYDQESKCQDQTMSQNFKNKQKMEKPFKRLNSNHSSFKVRLQKSKQDKIKIELSQSSVGQQKLKKLPQFQARLITFEPYPSAVQDHYYVQKVKDPNSQVVNNKVKSSAQAKNIANSFFDQPIDDLEANIPQITTKQRQSIANKKQQNERLNESRQSIYKQIDNANQFYIEEIVFLNTTSNIKNTITRDDNIKTGIQDQFSVNPSMDPKDKEIILHHQQPKKGQQNSIPNQSNNKSSQNKKDDSKMRILQKNTKINSYRQQLQLFGQLAAFFSKNSKTYKINNESELFIKNASVTWHLLVYLFFKYFYSMNFLFLHYYKSLEQCVVINKDQLIQYAQEMDRFSQTLKKIEKSMRKATQIAQVQQELITNFDYLKDLQNSQSLKEISEFYINQSGQQTKYSFTNFLKDLRASIFNQASKFIKNMNIGNILSYQSSLSTIFYEGLFRIFNSCIILYQLFQLTSQPLETILQIQKLSSPRIELFQKFYAKMTQQVLVKKK